MVFANTELLKEAGVESRPVTTVDWDDLQADAKKLTGGRQVGLGWGLKTPTATDDEPGLDFDGSSSPGRGQDATIEVGDDELEVPKRIHEMAYTDRSIDPVSLTQAAPTCCPASSPASTR